MGLQYTSSRTHPAADKLRHSIITESEADLTSQAGLGLIGMALYERTDLTADAQAVSPLRSDVEIAWAQGLEPAASGQ
jgi:hypothetical protein